MGVIGLRLDDFLMLYVDEMNAIVKAWNLREEELQKDSWERTRVGAAITIIPHVKKLPPLKKLLPLPWDHDSQDRRETVTKEEAFERLNSLRAHLATTE